MDTLSSLIKYFKEPRHRFWLILSLTMGLSLVLRIYRLGSESIWQDEGFSINLASRSLPEMIEMLYSMGDFNPPLHFITLHYWIGLFGSSEFATRFLSAIFGFFSVVMIYKLGKLIFNKETGIISAAILGLSAFDIHYSQEARTYSLLVLLSLTSTYFFVKLLCENRGGVAVAYIASSTLLIYAHTFGSLIIVAENLYYFVMWLRSKTRPVISAKRWISYQLLLAALFTPWLWLLVYKLIPQLPARRVDFWPIDKPSLDSIADTFISFSGTLTLFLIFIGLLIFLLVEKVEPPDHVRNSTTNTPIWGSTKEMIGYDIDNAMIYLLLFWLIAPIVIAFLISQFIIPIYSDKYLIEVLPAFYLLISRGLNEISIKHIKLAVIGIIMAISLLNVSNYYQRIENEQWRSIAQVVDANAKPSDLVLFNISNCRILCFDYYSKRTDYDKEDFIKNEVGISQETIDKIETYVKNRNRVWFVLFGGHSSGGLINGKLNQKYSLSYDRYFNGIEVCLFEKLPGSK